jgi:hypothetical protein
MDELRLESTCSYTFNLATLLTSNYEVHWNVELPDTSAH